tara:strand:+ start:3329 stop:3469 length:141 start_codon:yes stop_codon:yes gene_type:complete
MMQIGRFVSDYIDFKEDTPAFQKHVDTLVEEHQRSQSEGENDGERK